MSEQGVVLSRKTVERVKFAFRTLAEVYCRSREGVVFEASADALNADIARADQPPAGGQEGGDPHETPTARPADAHCGGDVTSASSGVVSGEAEKSCETCAKVYPLGGPGGGYGCRYGVPATCVDGNFGFFWEPKPQPAPEAEECPHFLAPHGCREDPDFGCRWSDQPETRRSSNPCCRTSALAAECDRLREDLAAATQRAEGGDGVWVTREMVEAARDRYLRDYGARPMLPSELWIPAEWLEPEPKEARDGA